jgi:iron(III) transport system ATP-binding protein
LKTNAQPQSHRPGTPPTAATADGFVSVRGLRKTFGTQVAVDEVSFGIQRGHTLALLGPSGCGKTTILRCIAGLETPDAGRITIGNAVVFDHVERINLMPEQRELGVVFQSYAVWPHRSVAENVGFPLEVRGVAARERRDRIERVLDVVGLAQWKDNKATDLSGGQQQRVALARALIHEPNLVLFDEPMSNLDAQLREQMRLELRMLQHRLGFTSVFVTHDQSEAFALADHVVVMNHGSVEMADLPRTVSRAPRSPFVARFLGLNVLPGKIVSAEAGEGDGACASVAVRLDGGCILRGACVPGRPAAPGDRVVACIRREHVFAHACDGNDALPGGLAQGGEQRLPGVVKAATFLGLQQECILGVEGAEIRAIQADAGLETDDRITVVIRPPDCIVLPVSEE